MRKNKSWYAVGPSKVSYNEIGIYIFGTGKGGKELLQWLRKESLNADIRYVVKGFFDNQATKQGTYYENILIMAPQKDILAENDLVLLASNIYQDEMEDQLLDIGVAKEQIVFPAKWFDEVFGNTESETELIYMNGQKQQIKLYDAIEALNQHIGFNKADHPLVSIIIPVHNQWRCTKACLLSILDNTQQDILYEVILADDASNDETVNADQCVKNVKVIRNPDRLGFLRNCNNAAQYAQGQYLVFLHNDTNVQKDWLTYLVQLFQQNDKAGMVGPKLIDADGKLREAGGIIWRDGSRWNYGKLDNAEKPEYNYVKEVDYVSGVAIMIRTNLWREIGGFDETYSPTCWEDADLAFELRKKGYKILYQPKSVVVHLEDSRETKLEIINKSKFLVKWKNTLEIEQYINGENLFWARDRSGGKKTILVIDYAVPHYDHHAGGRLTFQYLQLFLELGLHVLFIGDHYKREPYTTTLEQMGVEVLYGPWNKGNFIQWIKQYGKYLDYAYLNRAVIAGRYIDDIKSFSQAKVIYFGHDLQYLRQYRQYEIEKKPEQLQAAQESRELEFKVANKADVIHVISSYEQDIVKQEIPQKPIRHISYIFCDGEQDVGGQAKCFEATKDIMFVGGFNHKPNVDAVMWFVRDIFPKILEKIPEITLYIVGSNPSYLVRKLQSDQVIVTGYISDEELVQLYQKIRLVVVPLRYGAGVKGKVIEAIFQMTPVVTTTIGAEGVPGIENEVAIADDEQGFVQEVLKLYQNKDLWHERMQSAFGFVRENFSKQKAKETLLLDITLN